jgi:hypothetical protein
MNFRIKEPKQVVLHAQGGSGAGLKQWVGLTDEEIDDCEEEVGMPQYEISSADLYAFAQAVEAKLKEKNT